MDTEKTIRLCLFNIFNSVKTKISIRVICKHIVLSLLSTENIASMTRNDSFNGKHFIHSNFSYVTTIKLFYCDYILFSQKYLKQSLR